MSDYDDDILTWAERQAELLRRVAAGDAPNETPDWPNIIEEIETVGRNEWRAVEAYWRQAFIHDLKAEAWPTARDAPTWRGEARMFRELARDDYRPSMRQHVDIARAYKRALSSLPETLDDLPPLPVPAECPVTLDELLAEP